MFNKKIDGLKDIIIEKNIKSRGIGLIWSIFRLVLILGISFIILYPLLVQFSSSLMRPDELFDPTVKWIPRNISFDSYKIAFDFMNYSKAFINSFIFVNLITVLQLISCAFVGYSLARFEFKGKSLLFALVILTLVVPPQIILIPMYLNFRFFDLYGLMPGGGINLLDSYWPMTLMAITGTGLRNGLFIYIMREFFKGMPDQLEEAAYIDGAGPLKTFLKVMVPGAGSAFLIVFIFSFVWQWNDVLYISFFAGNVTLLPLSLVNFPERLASYWSRTYGEALPDPMRAIVQNSGMILFITPVLCIFGILQKYFIESVERTGIVG